MQYFCEAIGKCLKNCIKCKCFQNCSECCNRCGNCFTNFCDNFCGQMCDGIQYCCLSSYLLIRNLFIKPFSLCGFLSFILLVVPVYFMFTVLESRKYQCQNKIYLYTIVQGVNNFLSAVYCLYLIAVFNKKYNQSNGQTDIINEVKNILKFDYVTCLYIFILIYSFTWTIIGNVWIVNENKCQNTQLYQVAKYNMICMYLFLGFGFLSGWIGILYQSYRESSYKKNFQGSFGCCCMCFICLLGCFTCCFCFGIDIYADQFQEKQRQKYNKINNDKLVIQQQLLQRQQELQEEKKKENKLKEIKNIQKNDQNNNIVDIQKMNEDKYMENGLPSDIEAPKEDVIDESQLKLGIKDQIKGVGLNFKKLIFGKK